MILQEIFKDDLELLENKSVKKLLDYVQEQQKKSFKQLKKMDDAEIEMMRLFMHSEIILINGKSSKETLELIGDILSR